MTKVMLLRDENIFPSTDVLKESLGDAIYPTFVKYLSTISNERINLDLEWRFYKDSKAWLGKVTNKKKTICWLSVWSGYFKLSFYFTEKHVEAINNLSIAETLKDQFLNQKAIGKLLPLIVDIDCESQLNDVSTLISLKVSLK